MSKSLTFDQVVEAADRLTLEEQETLADLLRRRSAESRRGQLVRDARHARREYVLGKAKPTTPGELMREIRR